jgi:hypothetical protein
MVKSLSLLRMMNRLGLAMNDEHVEVGYIDDQLELCQE